MYKPKFFENELAINISGLYLAIVRTPKASSSKDNSKKDVPAKPTEPAKATSQPTNTVQPSTPAVQPATLTGTLEEKAKEVIRGNYGNGEVRKQKLGDQYAEIQSKVNEMYRNGLVK